MNRAEVIMAIKKVGLEFGKVMATLSGEEYAAGYRRACADLVRLFNEAPMVPDFETERIMMATEIKRLRMENDMLSSDCAKQQATIEELLQHVDLHEVLGIGDNSRKPRRVRR